MKNKTITKKTSKALPNVVWPKKSGLYNVVQILCKGEPFLRHIQGDKLYYHSEIIEKFAQEINVAYVKKLSKTKDREIPYLPGTSKYKIVGMGSFFFGEDRSASFSGSSASYGHGINKKHLELLGKISKKVRIYNGNIKVKKFELR